MLDSHNLLFGVLSLGLEAELVIEEGIAELELVAELFARSKLESSTVGNSVSKHI